MTNLLDILVVLLTTGCSTDSCHSFSNWLKFFSSLPLAVPSSALSTKVFKIIVSHLLHHP
ncbi:MAG: hypothetical protein OQK09_07785 [Colwellia sp.]|nr:hypothetical protein [Colwellia sp.]MCW8864060.1 hypothetical protein [Colwellia sp.]MCW9081401.1 hypothetical protein [Colwellia sp.]